MKNTTSQIIKELKNNKNQKPGYKEGMARFGITYKKAYGVTLPMIQKIAKEYLKKMDEGERDLIAQELWTHEYQESKVMAPIIATPKIGWKVIEKWIKEFENWTHTDIVCSNLLWKMPKAIEKALNYSKAMELWKKRTGFVIMAVLAVRYKNELNPKVVKEFFKAIERESEDERNLIKKAVNWALRQIGKSAPRYYVPAFRLAKKLSMSENKTARWIGKDAYQELKGRKPK